MSYLVVCKSQGKNYLLLNEYETGYAIQGYDNKEDVMYAFRQYTEKFKMDQTWLMSATMGMVQMNPTALVAPENPEDLRKYLMNGNVVQVSGGVLGRGYTGTEVNEDILKLEGFSIWDECMRRAGLKN